MSSVTDDTTSGKEITPDEGEAGTKSRRPRRRPRVSAKQVAHGAKVGSDAIRSRIASVVWLVAVLFAAVLALAAILVALDPVDKQNSVVEWLTGAADVLAGPAGNESGGIFTFESANAQAKNALANWGIAAVFYLVVGRVLERIIRP
jgi:hypothetical protein